MADEEGEKVNTFPASCSECRNYTLELGRKYCKPIETNMLTGNYGWSVKRAWFEDKPSMCPLAKERDRGRKRSDIRVRA